MIDEATSFRYKIIIPKEEPKQENCCTPIGQIKRYVDCYGCDRKPKQETLEEAAENFVNKYYSEEIYKRDIEEAIKFGAKCQAERMYSEEEVLELLNQFDYSFDAIRDTIPRWFEQFKK